MVAYSTRHGAGRFNEYGGKMVMMKNTTGGPSVKGAMVSPGSGHREFDHSPVDCGRCIGSCWESGVPHGNWMWVTTEGPCDCLVQDGHSVAAGAYVKISGSAVGRISSHASEPEVENGEIFRQIGHSLEAVTGGTDVLCLVTLQFN